MTAIQTLACIRAFVAIEIGEEARQLLSSVQARLKKSGAQVGWVPPDNIHLSLAFLGDIFPEQVQAMSAALDGIASSSASFELALGGLGTFGAPHKPRVVWAGIAEPPPVLAAIQGRVAQAAEAAGIPVDKRPFVAHLTLGRIRSGRNVDALTSAITSVNNTRQCPFAVSRILLMRSVLKPQGAVYSIWHESTLKGD